MNVPSLISIPFVLSKIWLNTEGKSLIMKSSADLETTGHTYDIKIHSHRLFCTITHRYSLSSVCILTLGWLHKKETRMPDLYIFQHIWMFMQTLLFKGHKMAYQCKVLYQSNIVCEYEVNLSTNEKVITEKQNFNTNC